MSRVAQQLAQSPRGEEAGECVTACEVIAAATMCGRDSFLFSDDLPTLRNLDFRTIAMGPDAARDVSESIRQGSAVGHGGRNKEPTVAID